MVVIKIEMIQYTSLLFRVSLHTWFVCQEIKTMIARAVYQTILQAVPPRVSIAIGLTASGVHEAVRIKCWTDVSF